jgi:hypothetical protein
MTLAALLALTGCSGGDEPEEPVKAEKEEDVPAEVDPKGEDEGDSADTTEAEPAEAETKEEEPAAKEPAEAAAVAEPAGFDGPKTWKYVTSFALNVRSTPDKDNSSVIRHVKWGDKVEVVINGEWAKLGPGEYISSKHLSDNDPALKHSKKTKAKMNPKKKGK